MLSVIRSPLASPALRTMASASSYVAMPSSPLSHPSYSSLTPTRLHISMRTPVEPYPSSPGKAVHGSYFNLMGTSATPYRFTVPCSPACQSLVPSPIPGSISSISLSHGNSNYAVQQLGLGRLNNSSSSEAVLDEKSYANTNSVGAQGSRKSTFKLAFPRPTLPRDDTLKAFSFADAIYSLGSSGTPHKLTWSDSFDSVATLKPIRGRVPTPYPKMNDNEWIDDVEEAVGSI